MTNRFNINFIKKILFIREGFLSLSLPDKSLLSIGNENSDLIAEIKINSWNALYRISTHGALGFAESYMNNEISSPNIAKVIHVFSLNRVHNKKLIYGKKIYNYINYIKHLLKFNSKNGSKKNISYHYDLGNDFYNNWLDNSMTYSAAIFDNNSMDLESAQNNKYKNLCNMTKIKADDEVLEIGCGWGGFAEYAAKNYHAKITGITLSEKQAEYAKKRIFKAGLNDLVKIKLIDYRDISKKYDKIISIEMFEAVGEKYWPIFFKKLYDNLVDNGLIGMQLISIKDDLFSSYKYNSDFIQKYIFPGGFLPSLNALNKVTNNSGLNMSIKKSFAKDYAKTLSLWKENFFTNWDTNPKEECFTENFKRMWDYYLSYCEAGFLSGSTDVHQIILKKK